MATPRYRATQKTRTKFSLKEALKDITKVVGCNGEQILNLIFIPEAKPGYKVMVVFDSIGNRRPVFYTGHGDFHNAIDETEYPEYLEMVGPTTHIRYCGVYRFVDTLFRKTTVLTVTDATSKEISDIEAKPGFVKWISGPTKQN